MTCMGSRLRSAGGEWTCLQRPTSWRADETGSHPGAEKAGGQGRCTAGTIEYLPVCRVTNLSRAVNRLKEAGFWTVGMDGYAQTTIDKMNKGGKIAIIMGSEGKGMRRLVEESCDMTVRLPISGRVESLNVSTAAAIALYEVSKK